MWGFGDGDRAGSDGRAGVCRCGGTDSNARGCCCRFYRSVRRRIGSGVGRAIGGRECGTERDAARRDARDIGGSVGCGGFAEPGGFADGGDSGDDRGRADAEVAGDGAG